MWNKKSNKMFDRLENLVKYFTAFEICDERIHIIENNLKEWDGYCKFNFSTTQGPVEITLTKLALSSDTEYGLQYTTYAGVNLFNVRADMYNVWVTPCMGYSYNLDAKDIDLAILELEQHLQYVYGDLKDRWEQYQLEEQLAWESHEQQIKELL